MMRTPDGHSWLELRRFLTPSVVADHRNAPVNALGYLRVMFAVDDIDETLERLRKRGAQLVGEVVRYAAGALWIVGACLCAALMPALRAARIDPVGALRQD